MDRCVPDQNSSRIRPITPYKAFQSTGLESLDWYSSLQNFHPEAIKGLRFSPSSPKPADLWDQHGQSVITSNSEHFTGFLNFKISCLRGDTSAADRFIVVCGLTADLSDDLRPWMAIYDARDSGVSC
ncbi:hypothetical protein FCULG_00012536 [Fusarium culmorum]|uniref:Uncharacterized protein n=1 Tax=Fusarium culmorum TaxID=5516 RepID=A0A2T4GY73_FUSCU|nr:hypothetical protein FCULG_00012536 [Fusarium culmorum]